MIYNNALDLIGNTPILNLKEAGYPNVFVKLEKAKNLNAIMEVKKENYILELKCLIWKIDKK